MRSSDTSPGICFAPVCRESAGSKLKNEEERAIEQGNVLSWTKRLYGRLLAPPFLPSPPSGSWDSSSEA
jgi:hypothetical protein